MTSNVASVASEALETVGELSFWKGKREVEMVRRSARSKWV